MYLGSYNYRRFYLVRTAVRCKSSWPAASAGLGKPSPRACWCRTRRIAIFCIWVRPFRTTRYTGKPNNVFSLNLSFSRTFAQNARCHSTNFYFIERNKRFFFFFAIIRLKEAGATRQTTQGLTKPSPLNIFRFRSSAHNFYVEFWKTKLEWLSCSKTFFFFFTIINYFIKRAIIVTLLISNEILLCTFIMK